MDYTGCLGCEFQTLDLKCKAFPKGIPLPILSGEIEHNKPLPQLGQKNQTIFQEITEETKAKLLDELAE